MKNKRVFSKIVFICISLILISSCKQTKRSTNADLNSNSLTGERISVKQLRGELASLYDSYYTFFSEEHAFSGGSELKFDGDVSVSERVDFLDEKNALIQSKKEPEQYVIKKEGTVFDYSLDSYTASNNQFDQYLSFYKTRIKKTLLEVLEVENSSIEDNITKKEEEKVTIYEYTLVEGSKKKKVCLSQSESMITAKIKEEDSFKVDLDVTINKEKPIIKQLKKKENNQKKVLKDGKRYKSSDLDHAIKGPVMGYPFGNKTIDFKTYGFNITPEGEVADLKNGNTWELLFSDQHPSLGMQLKLWEKRTDKEPEGYPAAEFDLVFEGEKSQLNNNFFEGTLEESSNGNGYRYKGESSIGWIELLFFSENKVEDLDKKLFLKIIEELEIKTE